MACPSLIYTSGNSLHGLGTWDGGTKITMLQTNGFIVTRDWPSGTFLYSVLLSSTITNYAARVINCAVTDDGYLFIYVRRTTPDAGYMSLFKHDIAAQTSAVHDAAVTNNNRLSGPSWNPYDGMLYELWEDGDTMRLLQWDPVTAGAYTELTSFLGIDSFVSNMLTFTQDGGAWFEMSDPVTFDTYPVRLDLGDFSRENFTSLAAQLTSPVPNSASSVLTSAVDQGWELHSDGSIIDTACTLFDSDSTARVHCGVGGRSTFIYPTAGGAGTAIYELEFDLGGWTVGRVAWGSRGAWH